NKRLVLSYFELSGRFMKNIIIFLLFGCLTGHAYAQGVAKDSVKPGPDTVKLGIYVTSIHDIDFKQKEYKTIFWLWLKYKNKDLDFVHNLEIPNAKNFTTAYTTIDTTNGRVYLVMKMECTMKNGWSINNFPFDRQTLRLTFENSQFDSTKMIFVPDTSGDHYDKRISSRTGNNDIVINGWQVDSFVMSSRGRVYKTGFGLDNLTEQKQTYSALRIRMVIKREAEGLYWKMFLGMYIAFLIAYICFYIHSDGMDSRFGLSVGSLFAVIGNKYIIDSSLPESTSFTLVDTMHGLTLFSIFLVITATAWSLRLVKQNKHAQARRFDMIAAQVLLLLFVSLNIYFVLSAKNGG
ncbi:MAG: hypothetical protein ACKOU7_10530, partial [Ferruginibacter sp.]